MADHKLAAPIPPYLYPQGDPDGSIDPSGHARRVEGVDERYRLNSFEVRLQGSESAGRARAQHALSARHVVLPER